MSWKDRPRPLLALLFALTLTASAVVTAHDAPLAASSQAGPAALAGIDAFVDQAIADWNAPGCGLAVVSGGEVVYARGFGLRDLERRLPVTPDTLFAIGSTTKAFTTTVLGTLADEGKVDWDRPLRTYLPEFRLHDPITSELISPRDLVTHRSGLPRHDLVWYNNHEITREEMVARLAFLESSAALRSKFQYNNLMYVAAGYLIEQLTGDRWEAAVRTRIFEPLGMTRSNFSVDDSQQDEDFAFPHRENDDGEIERIPFRRIDLVGPAGSINSSVREMSRWLLLNLNGGKLGDRRLINAATLADIHSPHMPTGGSPERPEISQGTYGLGWAIDTYRGHRRIHHGGGIDGFITSVMLFPDDDLGLVSFTNSESDFPELLNQHVADRMLGIEPIDWNGEALAERVQERKARAEAAPQKQTTRRLGTHPSHELADYAGRYQHPGYGPLAVALGDGSLQVTFNGIAAPLEHWHYDVWNGADTDGDPTFEDTKFLFHGDVDGNIAGLEVRFEPRVDGIVFRKLPDPRLFDPEFLRRLAGRYDASGRGFGVELVGTALVLNRPGAQRVTLVPDLNGRFRFANDSAVSLGFELDAGGNVGGAKLYRPEGVFAVKRVE
ncbi:MAG: serine hydrolase [bacterium]|nr:serine hydrolase [bacterium]